MLKSKIKVFFTFLSFKMRGPKFKGENTFQDYNKVSHKSVGFKIETRKTLQNGEL